MMRKSWATIGIWMAFGGPNFWNWLGMLFFQFEGRFTSQQSKIEALAPKCCSTTHQKNCPTGLDNFTNVVGFCRKHMPCLMEISQPGWINGGFGNLSLEVSTMTATVFWRQAYDLWPLTCPKWHGCASSLWTISHFNLVEGGTTKKNQRFAYLNPEKTHYMTPNKEIKPVQIANSEDFHHILCLTSSIPFGTWWNHQPWAWPPSPPSPIKLCTNSSELTLGSTPPWLNGSWDSEIQASSTRCRDLDVDGGALVFFGCWTLKQIKHISLSHLMYIYIYNNNNNTISYFICVYVIVYRYIYIQYNISYNIIYNIYHYCILCVCAIWNNFT